LLLYGFKSYKDPFLPTKTIEIDVTQTKKDMLNAMHHKTRYNINYSKRKGVQIKFSHDIHLFAQEWQKAARKRGMYLSQSREIKALYSSFESRAKIVFALKDNDLLGGILSLQTEDRIYYMYAYSTDKGKKLQAPSYLVWNLVLYAKRKNIKVLDFEGIYDERTSLKSWKGFTRFKQSFGGQELAYPLPMKKYFLPF